MNQFERGLLTTILALQRACAARGEPAMDHGATGPARQRAGRAYYGQLMEWEHGPRIAALHGDGYDDAARKRVSRALARLEAAGLVELWGNWGRNVTHVKLTPEGEQVARRLLAEGPPAKGPEGGAACQQSTA